ncbi:hypothetical protein PSCICP_38330 [Pseudomonas cichorii]|uniref:Secreted protein n=1 Tax=Pseudomonas cichorii TaxID=36746 RepID=A0ABQ1DS56_PSECI|nr:hypothetical protein PSCICP_38330 [Pseudomonas cichorii]
MCRLARAVLLGFDLRALGTFLLFVWRSHERVLWQAIRAMAIIETQTASITKRCGGLPGNENPHEAGFKVQSGR